MDILTYLTPVALLFSLAAMSQLAGINKELEKLRQEVKEIKEEKSI